MKMKGILVALLPCLALSAFAVVRVAVPQLPETMRPLAEVETNVAFSVCVPCDNIRTMR